jgi:hypothetical protein
LTQKNVTGIVGKSRLTEIQVELKNAQARLEKLTTLREMYLKVFRHKYRVETGYLYKFLTLTEFKLINGTSDKLFAVKKVINRLSDESRSIAKQIYHQK